MWSRRNRIKFLQRKTLTTNVSNNELNDTETKTQRHKSLEKRYFYYIKTLQYRHNLQKTQRQPTWKALLHKIGQKNRQRIIIM